VAIPNAQKGIVNARKQVPFGLQIQHLTRHSIVTKITNSSVQFRR